MSKRGMVIDKAGSAKKGVARIKPRQRAVSPSPAAADPRRAHRAGKRYWVKGLRP